MYKKTKKKTYVVRGWRGGGQFVLPNNNFNWYFFVFIIFFFSILGAEGKSRLVE